MMKLALFKWISTLTLLTSLSACDKFLNVQPSTTNVNPTTIKDFQEMLNSDSLASCNFLLADIMSDDVFVPTSTVQNYYASAYLWEKAIWAVSDNDFMYNSAYTRVMQLNTLLNRAENTVTSTETDLVAKEIILAQAKVHRAWFYLQLANLYGNDYTSGSAATDLGVPIILVPDANVKPKRATVKEVYNQVIKDLSEALASPNLPEMGQTIIHPGKAAAFTLMARTYLYMGDYAAALTNANAALGLKNTLTDYNSLTALPLSLVDQRINGEIFLAKTGRDFNYPAMYTSGLIGSNDLINVLDAQDQRRLLAFSLYGNNFTLANGVLQFNYSIAVPEAMLIKAECLARAGQVNNALELINTLRKNRLKNFTPLTGSSENILQLVLEERRRELFFHGGLRLFDLKRLNRDERFRKTLERKPQWSETVLSTLEPNSPRYLMEIAPTIIQNNTQILPNPR